MSKIAEELRAKKIYNDYEITKAGHPFVYVRTPSGREVTPRAVVLTIKGRKFKDAAWYQNGAEWYSYSSKEQRDEAKKEAFAWIEKHFPGMKMVTSPFGKFAWIPEEDLKEALQREVKP